VTSLLSSELTVGSIHHRWRGSIQAFGEAKLIAYCCLWTIVALPIVKVNGFPSCSCLKPRMELGG
jgi:hypothetical protein